MSKGKFKIVCRESVDDTGDYNPIEFVGVLTPIYGTRDEAFRAALRRALKTYTANGGRSPTLKIFDDTISVLDSWRTTVFVVLPAAEASKIKPVFAQRRFD